MGSLYYFLGIEVLSSASSVLLHQKKFLHDFFVEFHSSDATSVVYPLEINSKPRADEGDILSHPDQYKYLVGKLNFLIHTRSDISFVVQHLSQFMQNPCLPHMKVV